MCMGVLFTATSVCGSGKRLRLAGVGGMTLTSEPVSMRNFVLVCASLTKNRRLEVGPVALVALLGRVTKLPMVPAEGFGSLRVSGSWAVGAATSRAAAAMMWACLCDGGD